MSRRCLRWSTTRRSSHTTFGQALLNTTEPLSKGCGRVVQVEAGGPHKGKLQHDLWLRRITHLDLGLANGFHGANNARKAQLVQALTLSWLLSANHIVQLRCDVLQKASAKFLDELGCELLGTPACFMQFAQGHKQCTGV